MKILKISIIILILGISTIAYGATQWAMSKKLDNFQELTSWGLTNTNLRLYKFQDGDTICYVAYPTLNGNAGTPSLQCSIK